MLQITADIFSRNPSQIVAHFCEVRKIGVSAAEEGGPLLMTADWGASSALDALCSG